MATLVCFHAHPDDEAIATGGTMARASDEGHRVILVVATGGERGEVAPGVLAPGEDLGARRRAETLRAAEILGVHRVEFLGYLDSGMAGEPTNNEPGSFWTAPVDEAARRLADLLAGERVDAMTVYDARGGYGHPDHIQVHRVGVAAAPLVGCDAVYESTFDRDRLRRIIQAAREAGVDMGDAPDTEDPEAAFGTPGELITHSVDVTPWADRKRAAMAAHASQIGPESIFLRMDDATFAATFGIEDYVRRGMTPDGRRRGWIL